MNQIGVTLSYDDIAGPFVIQRLYQVKLGEGPKLFDRFVSTLQQCQGTPTASAASAVRSVQPISFPALGNQSAAFLIAGHNVNGDTVTEGVAFRRGDVLELIAVAAYAPANASTVASLAQYWAERADVKLKAVVR